MAGMFLNVICGCAFVVYFACSALFSSVFSKVFGPAAHLERSRFGARFQIQMMTCMRHGMPCRMHRSSFAVAFRIVMSLVGGVWVVALFFRVLVHVLINCC